MRTVWINAVLMFGLMLPAAAAESAGEREEQNFLFLLEEAYTQHRNELQLTPAVHFTKRKGTEAEIDEDGNSVKAAKTATQVRWPIEAEWGLTDRLEAQVGLSWIYEATDSTPVATENRDTKHNEDFEDMELGLRYKLVEQLEQWPTISLGYTLALPTGDHKEEFGAVHAGHEWVLLVSRDFGRWVGHLNAGFGIHFNETQPNEDGTKSPKVDLREFSYGAAAVYRLTDHWKGFLEFFHQFGEEIQANTRKAETALTILPGISYAAAMPGGGNNDYWELGLGVPVGLTSDALDWGLILRLRYEVQF